MSFVVLDTETTGLDPNINELVEVAYRCDGSIYSFVPYHTLRNAHPKALELNGHARRGLADKMLDRANTLRAYEELSQRLAGQIIVGSNPTFDLGFISRALVSYDLPTTPWSHRTIDVVTMAWSIFPEIDVPLGLGGTMKHLSEKHSAMFTEYELHTAVGDVLTTAELFDYMMGIRGKHELQLGKSFRNK